MSEQSMSTGPAGRRGSEEQPVGEHVLTRVLAAPRSLVFACMVEPERLTHFWGPTGMSTPLESITVDARPGGSFETVMVNDADGSRYAMRAVYQEVAPPERLVWVEPDSGVSTTVTFLALGEALTEVRIHRRQMPAWFLAPEALAGFATALDKMALYLQSLDTEPVPATPAAGLGGSR